MLSHQNGVSPSRIIEIPNKERSSNNQESYFDSQRDEESMISQQNKPKIRINEKGDEEELIDLQSQENLVIPLTSGDDGSSFSTQKQSFAQKFGTGTIATTSPPTMIGSSYRSEATRRSTNNDSSPRNTAGSGSASGVLFADDDYFFDNILTIKIPFTDIKFEVTYCQTTKTLCGSILLFVILYMYYIVFTLWTEQKN